MDSFPSYDDFKNNFDAGKTQLVWTWVSADLETPVSTYIKLTGDSKNSFLLESVEGGANLGRYSSIGLEPDLIWEYSTKSSPPVGGEDLGERALNELRRIVSESRIDAVAPEIPPMGPSGLFGYMGYGMIKLIEEIPDANPDDINIPDSIMIRPTIMVIFDNVQARICIVTTVRETKGDVRKIYDAAIRKLEQTVDRLLNPLTGTQNYNTALKTPLSVQSNTEKGKFFQMVDRAMEYIKAGDIFQVVIGQSFSAPFDLPAFALYRSLRRLNPSPFLFYFNFGGFQLVGSSPEILVRVRNRKVTIRPIAGTRKRGKDAAEDKKLEDELLADPKERAEHLMLLDLGRNDVGRVSKPGTVKVTESFVIEKYSHVQHIVSNVEGELREDQDSFDALFAGFPAGTVTGAPKIRAMEIIDELESSRRAYYGGCVGYFDGNGNLDTCIALRTALVKDGKVHVRSGAGVVADSNPESEYNECIIKAQAIVAAADDAVSQAQAVKQQKVI